MAIYRIYPEKDTTVWSEPNTAGTYGNAGLDEILEIGGYPDTYLTGRSQRALIQFSTSDIQSTINTKITGSFSSSLKLYLATAGEIPSTYTLYGYPVSQSWTNGTGKRDDQPLNTTGTSWKFRDAQLNQWDTLGCDFISSSVSGSQTFTLSSKKDLNMDVTSIVTQHYSESLSNYGILLKIEDSYENYTSASINLKYYSTDTNTIFPPYLEFKWDDTAYNTGSLSVLNNDIATITIKNHREKYLDSDTAKFRISAKPKYPARTFTTSSVYLTEYALPDNSYWGIKDEYSGEMIVDFDTTYTKVSADSSGSFFNVYMDSFQPERYYRLLIKTTLNGNTLVIDNRNIFKVERNG
jgi:hypothetical protein